MDQRLFRITLDKIREDLVEIMDLHSMWSLMRSRRVVDRKKEEQIKLNHTSMQQNELLLDYLMTRTTEDFDAFCECLRKSNQAHVAEMIRSQPVPTVQPAAQPAAQSAAQPKNRPRSNPSSDGEWGMKEIHKQVLRKNLIALTKDLNPSVILDELIQGDILTMDDKERLSLVKIRRDQAYELISILMRKGPNAFWVFLDSLKQTHSHLYHMLSNSLISEGN
ncbi:hypothetical protein CAPTEDRAFT_223766 [Capitella teleta]|uniref:CARD domain-containing protein n=1 Tax=Capitella teleta TaxID=283909 RepID=R7U2C2_CAPTE|nr:hypothetical protein CAPTEDRAFT_223766 [Capitella teleta]|eukprot:ELU00155.1 hypothetical protein CAPTEDRAFT_223766 [Capitella teleta]